MTPCLTRRPLEGVVAGVVYVGLTAINHLTVLNVVAAIETATETDRLIVAGRIGLAMVPVDGAADIGAGPVAHCRFGIFGSRSSRNFVDHVSGVGGLKATRAMAEAMRVVVSVRILFSFRTGVPF